MRWLSLVTVGLSITKQNHQARDLDSKRLTPKPCLVVFHLVGEIADGGVIVTAQDSSDSSSKRFFTMVPNSVLEAVLAHSFKPCQKDTVFLLARLTYGFHQSDAPITPKHIEQYTHHHVNTIRQALRDLRRQNIIVQTKKAHYGFSARYRINEDIDQWMVTK